MREICKAGNLRQRDPTYKPSKSFLHRVASKVNHFKNVGENISEKTPYYLSVKCYCFCVHDDRAPFLETYGCENDIPGHRPQRVYDLINCSYISRAVEDERTFVIGFDDCKRDTLEFLAGSAQERQDWMSMLSYKLTRLGCLPPVDNAYGPLPFTLPSVSIASANGFSEGDNVNLLTPNDDTQFSMSPPSGVLNTFDHHQQELYEAIGHRPSISNSHNNNNHTEFHNGTSVVPGSRTTINSCSHLSRQSTQPPPLPRRNPDSSRFLFVTVGEHNTVNNTDLHTENPYASAPVYHPITRRTTSSESEYDQPSPRLPSSLPPITQSTEPAPPPLPACSPKTNDDHIYENNAVDSVQQMLTRIAPTGRYTELTFPPRPVLPTDKTGSHSRKSRSSTSSQNNLNGAAAAAAAIVDNNNTEQQPLNEFATTNGNSNNFSPFDEPQQQQQQQQQNFVDNTDYRVELPIAPLSPPPLPPNSSPENNSSNSYGTLKVKLAEVRKLKDEIEGPNLFITIPTEAAIKGLALVEMNGSIWISGWNVKYNKILSFFHVGDQVLAIDKKALPPTINQTISLLNTLAFSGPVEFLIKRLPYGKTFYFERNVQGKMLGLTRRKGKNEIIELEPNSIAEKSGFTPKTNGFLNPAESVNWFITEVNGRPLNYFSKNNEAGFRLDSVGLEVTIVVQPVDFIKMMKKALKQQKKNYKEYVIG